MNFFRRSTAATQNVAKAVTNVPPPTFGIEIGHQIFVYNHVNTNQVIYSLTRTMNNTQAMKQLTFVGKKTVPAALRKDMWKPLCVLSFPNQLQGLSAYRKLREFKHLHEVAYPVEIVSKDNKAGERLVCKEEKKIILMDQKANSIADMAAVLAIQGRLPTEKEIELAKLRINGPERLRGRAKPRRGLGSRHASEALEFQGKLDGVSVWWADLLDAEFAETWPAEVRHGPLVVSRNTAVWPPPEGLVSSSVSTQEVNDSAT